jgi:hypothetical protein
MGMVSNHCIIAVPVVVQVPEFLRCAEIDDKLEHSVRMVGRICIALTQNVFRISDVMMLKHSNNACFGVF